MCVKSCLCNSCHKRDKCSDCTYIDMRDISNSPWSLICSTTGIQSCDYYINPPEIYHETKEESPTIIKFKNGSTIETIDRCENSRNTRARIYQLVDLCEFHWWQRLYLRFLDSDLIRRINRKMR